MIPQEYLDLVRASTPRPLNWADIVGNTRTVEQIREAISAARAQQKPLVHTLLFGPPGCGKSTLARIAAADMQGGFIETTASTLETTVDLIRLLDKLNRERERTGAPSVLFLDEVHMLGQAKGRQSIDQEVVFSVLEDWRLEHNLLGKTYTNYDGVDYRLLTSTFLVWPFCAVAATTEPGMLSSPLLRRFLLHTELDPYSEDDITRILLGSAQRLAWPLDPEAATELSRYARRNPGRSYQLLTAAHNRAVATGRDHITLEVAKEVIDRLRLYPLGLGENDIRILKLLAERAPRGVGAAEISRAVGISQGQFTMMLEPYLRALNFVEVLSRRVIRPEGLVYLAQLGQVDAARPEVRAAMSQTS